MRPKERIPLHDHVDNNSGGRIDRSTITAAAGLLASSGGGGGSGGSGGAPPFDGLPWFVVTDYGALGDGTTNDTAAINLAIAALNTAGGGTLYVPAGTYLCSAGLTSITVHSIVRGDGIGASRIDCSSATANLFTSNSSDHAPMFRDLSLVNTHATPTAGAAINVTGAGLFGHYQNLRIYGFWTGVRVQAGAAWSADHMWMDGIRKYAWHISNAASPDSGDWTMHNVSMSAETHSPDAAVRIDSSGGGRITSCKINGSDPATGYNHGIDLAIAGTDATSILIVNSCSIENVRGDGIHVTQADTAVYSQIVITGNQINLISNNSGKAVSIVAEDTEAIEHIIVKGNIFSTSGTARTPIALTKIRNAQIVGNEVAENFEGQLPYTNSGSTGVQQYYPGSQIAYTEFTSAVSPTATVEASANTIVTASAFTFDGQGSYRIEFFSPNARPDVAANSILRFWLFEDGSSIGRIAVLTAEATSTAGANTPVSAFRHLTPTAGSHTYSIRATVNSGTASVSAGAGGAGAVMPGYIRITKA